MTFADLVEEIKTLSFDEKKELQYLLNQYLIEEKREEIYDSYQQAKVREIQGKLQFSANIDHLKSLMEEE